MTHVHKSATWSCNSSRTTCDFVRGRVGTYQEISFTAVGSVLWGPVARARPSLAGWCAITSLSPTPKLQLGSSRRGDRVGAVEPHQGQGCQTMTPSGPTTVPQKRNILDCLLPDRMSCIILEVFYSVGLMLVWMSRCCFPSCYFQTDLF